MKIEAYNLCEKINDTSDEAGCEHEGCKNGCRWKNIHNYFLISPQRPQRSWMEEKTLAFSYKCLPLKTANQLGWQISCPIDFSCTWGGDFLPESLKIEYKDTGDKDLDFENKKIIDLHIVESHFGHGILTFNIPYIFRTPKKKALYIRGPTNWYKEYCQYLDAVLLS